jgi:hypothetical protein
MLPKLEKIPSAFVPGMLNRYGPKEVVRPKELRII